MRLKEERDRSKYSLQITENEYEMLLDSLKDLYEKRLRLEILKDSSFYQRESCFIFDSSCSEAYAVRIAYLDDELKNVSVKLKLIENRLERTLERRMHLSQRVANLEKDVFGDVVEERKTPIPSIKSLFRCADVEGWNKYRGVFLKDIAGFALPFETKVLFSGAIGKFNAVTLKKEPYLINLVYTGDPVVEKGEKVSASSLLFKGTKGNPVANDTVLFLISEKGKPLDPSFICDK